MATTGRDRRRVGDVVVLRYVTNDGRIEICWPCRVVADREDLLALFIAAGSPYKAGPKKSAAEKRRQPRTPLPPDEYVWRNDTLRLMLPGRSHSVSLFWAIEAGRRSLLKYFVNMEEPFRRTAVGFDTMGGARRHPHSGTDARGPTALSAREPCVDVRRVTCGHA